MDSEDYASCKERGQGSSLWIQAELPVCVPTEPAGQDAGRAEGHDPGEAGEDRRDQTLRRAQQSETHTLTHTHTHTHTHISAILPPHWLTQTHIHAHTHTLACYCNITTCNTHTQTHTHRYTDTHTHRHKCVQDRKSTR